jgi:hypothetical protein
MVLMAVKLSVARLGSAQDPLRTPSVSIRAIPPLVRGSSCTTEPALSGVIPTSFEVRVLVAVELEAVFVMPLPHSAEDFVPDLFRHEGVLGRCGGPRPRWGPRRRGVGNAMLGDNSLLPVPNRKKSGNLYAKC